LCLRSLVIEQLILVVGLIGQPMGFVLRFVQQLFQMEREQLVFKQVSIRLFPNFFLEQHSQHIYQYKYMEYVRFNIQLEYIQFVFFHVEYNQFC
jgi:hypothetical protein